MSIINDALKKARKEFEFKNNASSSTSVIKPGEEKPAAPFVTKVVSDKKWTVIVSVSLFIIASLLGSLVLFKGMSGRPASTMQETLNQVEQKINRDIKRQDIVKLNGIVYGPKDRWAIVNDTVIKEGDTILGGQVISITKDLVKIGKSDGSELVLSLK